MLITVINPVWPKKKKKEKMTDGRPKVTSTDLSPIIQIITWVLLAFILLAVVLRLLTRYYLLRQIRSDDWSIATAFVSKPSFLLTRRFCLNLCDTNGI